MPWLAPTAPAGTTLTFSVGSNARDFLTLQDANLGLQRDLVALDEIVIIEMYDDSVFTGPARASFTGWITDRNHYVLIRPGPGQGFNPLTGTGVRTIFGNANDLVRIGSVTQGNCRLVGNMYWENTAASYSATVQATGPFSLIAQQWIQNSQIANAGNRYGQSNSGGDDSLILSNIVVGDPGGALGIDTGINSSGGTGAQFFNNLVYWSTGEGMDIPSAAGEMRNCACFNALVDDFDGFLGPANANASSDGTAQGTNPLINLVGTEEFVDPANLNFNLAVGSQLFQSGEDLSSLIDVGFDGETFNYAWLEGTFHGTNGAWDRGAYLGGVPISVSRPTVMGARDERRRRRVVNPRAQRVFPRSADRRATRGRRRR